MENNEETVDETTEETNETVEETTEEQTDYKAEAAKYKAMYERAKKPKSNKPKVSNELPTRDDIRILANKTDEEIDQLEIISKGLDIPLKEASENIMFKSWQEANEAKIKSEKAQLGTSGGSAAVNAPNISEMTKEEHQAYSRKIMEG